MDVHNPFEVLELAATATPREVSRQKDKLLGMLELGLDRAKRYTSSLGDRERTQDLVRSAAQELERPRSRLSWELWLPPSDEVADRDLGAAMMRRALALHRELLKETANGTEFGADELDELGAAWDEVLSYDDLDDRVARRARELEHQDDVVDEVVDAFSHEIREQMMTMLERGPVIDLDDLSSELASEVARDFANRKVELLELSCSRMSPPVRGARATQNQQWNGLVREYAATVEGRGEHLRRTAFQAIAPEIGNRAVKLFNELDEHRLSLSMFTWLRDEAQAVADDVLHELHANNAKIVNDRIDRDNADAKSAAYYAEQEARRSLEQPSTSGRSVIWIGLAVVIAMIRLGKGCDTNTKFSPNTPPSYRIDRPLPPLPPPPPPPH